MSEQTKEQKLLSKLYECQEEMQTYVNNVKIDVDGKSDLNYKTMLTLLTAKKDLNELVFRLEKIICDKQELM
jgi:hypothetical protein